MQVVLLAYCLAEVTDIYLSTQKSWKYCVSRNCIYQVRDREQSSARKLSRTRMMQTMTASSLAGAVPGCRCFCSPERDSSSHCADGKGDYVLRVRTQKLSFGRKPDRDLFSARNDKYARDCSPCNLHNIVSSLRMNESL